MHVIARSRPWVIPALWMTLATGGVQAAEGTATDSDIGNLIDGGKVSVNFRYRYEWVDDDDFDEDANASTVRSRLTLQSGAWQNFAFLAEFDDIREVGADDFNAGEGNTPGRTDYPVVADPEGTEVNQAYIDYKGIGRTTLRFGRQRINLDNQRFVGGVGWRQNEQTYDAFSVTYDHDRFDLFYAYVEEVQRIYGSDVPAGDHDQDGTHLLNARTDIAGIGTLAGYYYHIDNEDSPSFSTGTAGLRLTGLQDLDPVDVRYAFEFARQQDAGDNPVSYDANYYLVEGGVIFNGTIDVGLGWEVLEGDENTTGKAFRTPLATLHAFNGWVDKFLVTPQEGLDDRFVKVKGTFGKTLVEMHYHSFDGEDSGSSLGEEWNLQVGQQFHKRFRADLVYGDFASDDDRYSDTRKGWIMLTASLP